MNKKIWAGVIATVVVIGLGTWFFSNQSKTSQDNNMMVQEKMMPKEGSMMQDNKMMDDKDSMMKDNTMMDEKKDDKTMSDDKMMDKNSMMQEKASYNDYSEQAVADAQKSGKKVVLFFHATWCPTCKAADAAFKADLSTIPNNVALFKTDYDSNKELKTKYGVTTQHTFVQIDKEGTMVTKWVSGDVDMLIKNIK